MEEDCISMVSFDSKVFDVVNFFNSLDIPPFIIRFNDRIATIIEDLMKEIEVSNVGKERILKSQTEILVIELLRHILKNRLFLEELSTNATYFKDPRLIDLFNFIKANLGGDLSNKVLAQIANVSEDYVGQYFKMLTGINPQDYIEYQRMETAVELLRTSKKSIRDIGKDVGYKDTAYFCRRFKMMYGVPAGKMRRRESLINVQ
jgi:AraC family transcriptional activator of mtrCDE